MREYSTQFTCLRCGYTVPIKIAYNRPPHPRLEPRREQLDIYERIFYWMLSHGKLILLLLVIGCWMLIFFGVYLLMDTVIYNVPL